MKRSEWISILGIGGIYLLTLHSCDNSDDPLKLPSRVQVYGDAGACAADGNNRQDCETAQREAAEAHALRAPRYADRAACEQVHGPDNCDSRPTGDGQKYLPLLAGFALGSALGVANAVPVHYDRDGNARVAGGNYVLGRRCDPTPNRPDSCHGGGGSGGSGGNHWSHGNSYTLDTSNSNMRTVTRGGFGHSVHGTAS